MTTPAVLDVVRASLAAVNAELCAAIGPRALGLSGDEIGLRARQVEELGLVGDPSPSAPAAVVDALAAGRVPVVAPLAAGPLNVNADEAAAALAVGLRASRILFVTDVPGVLLDGELATVLPADVAEAGARRRPLRGRHRAEADGRRPCRPRRRAGLDRCHRGSGVNGPSTPCHAARAPPCCRRTRAPT